MPIEDNPLTQRISTEISILSGAQVTAASGTAEALKILQEDARYDAALIDFDLPDIDRITLAQQLAYDYPTLSLIGFSAHVIDETLSQGTNTLFLGIIQELVPRDELSRLITHYLHGSVTPPFTSENDNKRLDFQQLAGDIQIMEWQKVHGWLAFFKQHTLPVLDEIDATHTTHDDERMRRLTHQLKGSCTGTGMRSTNAMCATLEQQSLGDLSLRKKIQQGLYEVEHWLEKEKLSHA